MRALLIIVLMLFFINTYSQQTTANWTTVGREVGVVNYTVEKSADGKIWQKTSPEILPKKLKDSNTYSYALTETAKYRIAAQMYSNVYYTDAIYVAIGTDNSATITDANYYKSWWFWDNIYFSVINANNVNYFLIEKTTNGTTWEEVTKINYGDSYSYSVFRLGKKVTYRVSVFYKDGTKGEVVIFK
jgi:hypothetical protein